MSLAGSSQPQNWSRAYALQALSDLRARETLELPSVDRCHSLHFLQMAAEKTCKAHLSAENNNRDVKRTHAYVRQVLPVVARAFYSRLNNGTAMPQWQVAQVRRMSAEIELLAPACDDGESRMDNSEYPWLDGQGLVQVPCEYKFMSIDEGSKTFTLVIKLLRAAANVYAR